MVVFLAGLATASVFYGPTDISVYDNLKQSFSKLLNF